MALRSSFFPLMFLCFLAATRTLDAAGAAQLQAIGCSTDGNYTATDAYAANLKQFLAALPNNTVSNNGGFFNGTVGRGAAMVYGLAMCSVDFSRSDCNDCLTDASSTTGGLAKRCPGSATVIGIFDQCMLRYSNRNFFGTADTDIIFTSTGESVASKITYSNDLKQGLAYLSAQAASSPDRFAASATNPFAVVQCTCDLPSDKCKACIDTLSANASNLFEVGTQGERKSYSCRVRYSNSSFTVVPLVVQKGQTPDQTPRQDVPTMDPPSSPSSSNGGLIQKVTIPVSITIIVLLLAVIVTKHFQKKWKIAYIYNVTGMKEFSISDIKHATGNFGREQELGKGAFGQVYKGEFKINGNKKYLAVKCVVDPSAGKSLLDELVMLAQLNHTNVVQLVGFCSNNGWFQHAKGLYICNEFFPNGSLEKRISALTDHPFGPLSWPDRFKIICGICDGLKYLHDSCNTMIAHMDLKPSNILLDNRTVPKIADFGISKALAKANQTYKLYTKNTIGTSGYMAPEYVRRGRFGRKCDIYSLGVLILAIVMGKEPDAYNDPSGFLFIRDLISKFTPQDRGKLNREASWLESLDDKCLEDAEMCIRVAFECVDADRDKRPKAAAILSRLTTGASQAHVPQVPLG